MARFSVDQEDDSAGPSNNPWSKKQRTTTTFTRSPPAPAPAPAQEQPHHPPNLEPQLVEDYDDDDEEVESEYEDEEEDEQVDGESENDEEEDGESEYDYEEDGEEDEEDEDEEEGEDQNEAGHPSNGVACNDDRERNSVSVILTDPDVLDCPICFDHLSIPVYQCENGHLVCSSCCSKLGSKCPSCAWPIYYHRCRGIEKVIESVKISCQNMEYGCEETENMSLVGDVEVVVEPVRMFCRNRDYGCTETLNYTEKTDHEETCAYAPCPCPLQDCSFVGSAEQLSLHFSSKHWDSGRRFQYNCPLPVYLCKDEQFLILQAEEDGLLFLLNKGIENIGLTVMITCIGPSSSKEQFFYDVVSERGISSLRLKSCTQNFPGRVEGLPPVDFLLIPFGYVSSSGQLNLEVCIWNSTELGGD
ncbi:E3 ubiquitin-protein ligase SINA-like 10 [Camellia lanceoleosa]|uniref:E3 ubiquitin-protein ligase SINA-like 10 n=1 Tax=Camellia lanceoleosa TaxID=1840588 RepID=A0ACC0J5G5_9ERIC|nr:E3 ubiquitin-protein ligase SINA-like 10 [Camellia lanceoleosa]